MYSITFFLRTPQSDRETPINLFVTYGGRRIKIPTGTRIHPELWNKEDQSVITSSKTLLKHNRTYPGIENKLSLVKGRLTELRKVVEDYFALSQINQEAVDLDKMEANIRRITNPQKAKIVTQEEVCAYLREFIQEAEKGYRKFNGRSYTSGTIKNYRNLLQALNRFQKHISKTIKWDMINKSLYIEFMEWQAQNGFSINYSGKHAKDLKSIMRFTYEEGIHKNESFRSKWFAVPSECKEKSPLNLEEMQLLFDHKLTPGSTLCIARDMFLLGCFTGLRVSDIKRIDKSMITETGDGRKRLKIITQKTNKPVVTPLNSYSDSILRRYGYTCPPFVEQTVNRLIKKIALEAGVSPDKAIRLRFHIGRHSFATHLFYVEKLHTGDIMHLTGHTTERNFMRYVNVKPDEVATRLEQNKFFK